MQFRAADGTMLTGEVWSPGPAAKSVWVLLPDGTPMAVRLPTKAGQTPEQLMVCPASPERAAPPKATDRVPYTPELARRMVLPWRTRRLAFRNAPPLPEKDWQLALQLP